MIERDSVAETEKLVAVRICCSSDMLAYEVFLDLELVAAAAASSLPRRR